MPLAGNRRKLKFGTYEILFIPQGGGSTRSIKANAKRVVVWGTSAFLGFFLLFLLVFRFTPLGILVGLDIRSEEARQREREETQRRLETLAEEVGVLKDYNLQLRKALGEQSDRTPATTAEAQKPEPAPVEQQVSEDFSAPLVTPAGTVTTREAFAAKFPLREPVAGVITQGFLPDERHFGVDYAAKIGTPVHAAADGYVVYAGWTYDDGNMVIISHGSGYITIYKHNNSLLKSTGSVVRRGETVALLGNTGVTSKGPHVHFEVLKDGVPVDPMLYVLGSKTML